ncbi:hypothetical protein [Polaribacter sp. HL-MS24]|uniref:hypothetical protein n=1 Tax=Polaribacter sp. HL-MS24 TaxID=3077735 RepID=UPI002934FA61|nr:hypothetical protein [Polaribacter sp. HL-MS24]WOC39616.1 hypothetical protein RRF69_08075 [Polaribacter sp. HL-MS24]
MKYISKIAFITILSLTLFACSENEKEQETLIDLTNMNLELSIDFSKGKFEIEKGINVLAKEMTDYIYDDKMGVNDKISNFNIRKSKSELLINIPSDNNSNLQQRMAWDKPCKTKSKTCRSKSCVEKTLKEILGDGSRDVDIKYRRNTFSVTIEYTYQDC